MHAYVNPGDEVIYPSPGERVQPDIRIYSHEINEDIVFDGLQHHSIAAEQKM